MNPFDWRGPDFLAFYAVLTGVVVLAARQLRRRWEDGPVPVLPEMDPYLVAYLRDGQEEVIRVVCLSLCDRGLLKDSDRWLVVTDTEASSRVRRPLERAILRACNEPRSPRELYKGPEVLSACRELEASLRREGLLPSPPQRRSRSHLWVLATVVLVAVAMIKVVVAVSRGRHNIMFLILAAVAAVILLSWVIGHRRTTRGDRLLADLRVLFGGLRDRRDTIVPGGGSNELALLLGVYGLSSAPLWERQRVHVLFRQSVNNGSNCGSGGSSCGSGSSCGGGGGGGSGCGGCGG